MVDAKKENPDKKNDKIHLNPRQSKRMKVVFSHVKGFLADSLLDAEDKDKEDDYKSAALRVLDTAVNHITNPESRPPPRKYDDKESSTSEENTNIKENPVPKETPDIDKNVDLNSCTRTSIGFLFYTRVWDCISHGAMQYPDLPKNGSLPQAGSTEIDSYPYLSKLDDSSKLDLDSLF